MLPRFTAAKDSVEHLGPHPNSHSFLEGVYLERSSDLHANDVVGAVDARRGEGDAVAERFVEEGKGGGD